MTLKLHNSMTRGLEVFEPQDPKHVRVYGCGPTIYDFAHIGNFRTFAAFDLLHRTLRWKGFGVEFVVNYTDVDDKTIRAATAAGVTIREYTPKFADAFEADGEAIGLLPFTKNPRATDYVPQMVEFVVRLIEKGLAYVVEGGSVYFSIAEFPGYGKLSGIDPDSVRPGARVAVDEYGKDDLRDFALWKAAKAEDEAAGAAWDSPWGRGRPGWHLECSVMSIAEMGNTLDLHVGGEDLKFPHHEDEIAQSEGATGEPFVRYWMHVKHLLLEGRKMSKSLGNTTTIRQLLDEGVAPAAIRHQLLSAHYRSELNFTRLGLEQSGAAVQRLVDFRRRVSEAEAGPDGTLDEAVEASTARALVAFEAALDDDLNTPEAFSALFGLIRDGNAALDQTGTISESARAQLLGAVDSMDEVFGLLTLTEAAALSSEDEEWIEERIMARNDARGRRDFAAADAIRDELSARGIVLEDAAGKTRWKRLG